MVWIRQIIASPGGEAGECNEPDEECGKKMIGFYVETDLF